MYNSNIVDPIHGLIKVSEIEKWIFSQKPFSRLRRIKQNTFLYLVFPSANHTRFEHSIGVMHLASQIYSNANDNYSTGIFKKNKYKLEETKDFKFVSVSEILEAKEKLLVQELRLAALLHDVGHGPMSHLFDHYTLSGTDFLTIILADDELKGYVENFNNLIKSSSDNISHETVSCMFVIKLIERLKKINTEYTSKFNPEQKEIIEQLDAGRIVEMIEPGFNKGNSKLIMQGLDFCDFFSSIISSFPLDADRMDYMYRDSYFSGVNYGLYDKSRLFMSFIPIEEKGKVSLGIKESGIDSIIRFIQSRTHLYNQVYFHKTNRAANCMLDYACRDLKSKGPIVGASNYEELESFYWNNSDELFLWNTLKEKVTSDKEAKMLSDLVERNLVKRIFQHKIILINKEVDVVMIKKKLDDLHKSFLAKIEQWGEDVILIDKFPNTVFKDVDKSRLRIVEKTMGNYNLRSDWQEFNKEMRILEHEVIMFRIYLKGRFNSRDVFNEKKVRILEYLKDLIGELESLGKN